MNAFHNLAAAQFRHDYIQQHQINVHGVCPKNLECFFSIASHQDGIARAVQHLTHQLTDCFIVFSHKDGFRSSGGGRFFHRISARRKLFHARDIYPERAPLSWF
ncbi:MAG TPA: hypothetical protein PLI09_02585 [Candidatus Hydrogenedentes bacterium]|nr:hypothetical protein [Candidatus Hydrogenedentota bacterium]